MSERSERIVYHAALPDDWAAAQAAGTYTVSTRDRSLTDEGFIHASYQHQVARVADAIYADVDELVLLVIDCDALDVEVIDESATGDPDDEHYPHIYGPVPVEAVVHSIPWLRDRYGRRIPTR